MFELKPLNKYVWIDPITAENKVGSLYIVSHSQNSYQLGKVLAFSECDESKGLSVGDTVLYDALGATAHRLGKQSLTTVPVKNILAIVSERDDGPVAAPTLDAGDLTRPYTFGALR